MKRRQFLGAMAGCALAPGSDRGRRFAATPFGRIAYLESGERRQPGALFLHGFPLSAYQWRGALERLAPVRHCVAPDFLALGQTEVAEGQGVAPADQVAMLARLLDTLAMRAVDIVASDSGGAAAQLFLAQFPQRVRSLLLTNCDTEFDSPPAAMQPVFELSRSGEYVDRWLLPWWKDKALARSPQGFGGMCYTDPAHPTDRALDDYFAPLVVSARRKALVHRFVMGLEKNPLAGIGPSLRRYRGPVRVLWGTGDTIFSAQAPASLAAAFPNFRGVRDLPGRKLFWPEELPEVVAEEARRLWID